MSYEVKKTRYEPADVAEEELITIKDAAELLGMTMPGVIAAIQRGAFTEIINREAVNPQHGRRLLLRAEVEADAERRRQEDKGES